MNIVEPAWTILRRMPSLAAWKLVHSIPPALIDPLLKVSKRPKTPPGLSRTLLGVRVQHPIGIAAGFDKDSSLAWAAWTMGAGFHVIGSVLPKPWPGVEPKILLRLSGGGSINRLGLPSKGADKVLSLMRRLKGLKEMPIAINIAALSPEGYGEVFKKVKEKAAWIEVNISCPNVREHASFEDPDEAAKICKYVPYSEKPVLLKIPSTANKDKLIQYVDLARSCGFHGIVAGNTRKIKLSGKIEAGLGGAPLYPITLRMVRIIREYSPTKFTIIAVGGIDTGEKALELLEAGADAIEVLTAIVHRGPLAPWLIALELYEALRSRRRSL
ncbi:MAG: hypothetical protein ABWW69_06310 [Pyrodictiaceae archaeon]